MTGTRCIALACFTKLDGTELARVRVEEDLQKTLSV